MGVGVLSQGRVGLGQAVEGGVSSYLRVFFRLLRNSKARKRRGWV